MGRINTYTYGKLTVRSANLLLLISILSQFAIGIIIGLIASLLSKKLQINILLLVTQIFAVFVPCIIYLKIKGVSIKDTFRIKPLKPEFIFTSLLLGISSQYIAQMLNLPILIILSFLGELPPTPIEIPKNVEGLIMTLGIVAVAPAIFEELMLRGIIMKAYEIRGTKAGIIISSIFFGLIHMDIKNLVGPIFFGIVFGFIVIRTGSILAGMIAHFSNNAFAVIIGYIYENYSDQFSYMVTLQYVAIAFFASILIFVFVFKSFYNKTEWTIKPPLSTIKGHFKAAFLNAPIIIVLITYFILQIFNIAAIVNGIQ